MYKQLLKLSPEVVLRILQNISLCYNYRETKAIYFVLQSYYQIKTYDIISIKLVMLYKITYQHHLNIEA